MKSLSGDTYKYKDSQIEVLPYYLYEVSLYEIYKNRFNILSNKLYTSNKFLNIKSYNEVRNSKNSKIVRYIDLVGAPQSFITDNNLPIYKLKTNKKKNEKGKN